MRKGLVVALLLAALALYLGYQLQPPSDVR